MSDKRRKPITKAAPKSAAVTTLLDLYNDTWARFSNVYFKRLFGTDETPVYLRDDVTQQQFDHLCRLIHSRVMASLRLGGGAGLRRGGAAAILRLKLEIERDCVRWWDRNARIYDAGNVGRRGRDLQQIYEDLSDVDHVEALDAETVSLALYEKHLGKMLKTLSGPPAKVPPDSASVIKVGMLTLTAAARLKKCTAATIGRALDRVSIPGDQRKRLVDGDSELFKQWEPQASKRRERSESADDVERKFNQQAR